MRKSSAYRISQETFLHNLVHAALRFYRDHRTLAHEEPSTSASRCATGV
jgi:hypothetical protein